MEYPHHGALGQFVVSLLLTMFTAFVYLRGWLDLRAASSKTLEAWRAGSFLLGLFLLWVAVASPIAALDHEFLTVHMIQHLLLMTFAAPLILLGEPGVALVCGVCRESPLPLGEGAAKRRVRVPKCGEIYPHRALRATFSQGEKDRPVVWSPRPPLPLCWLAAVGALVVWHIPAAFTLGMQSQAWHAIEHASFLGTGFLFWWPVVQPWPSVSRRPDWSIILYLFLATLPCDVLSAFLVFSERVAYPVYLSLSGQSSLSVLADQQCAGALMWTCVTIVYLVAGAILSLHLLSPQISVTPEIDPQSMEVPL